MRFPTLLRRTIVVAAIIAFVVVALGVAFVWRVGTHLTAPAFATVDLPASYAGTEVTFASGSGALLKGNFAPGTRRQGIVILMHGVRTHRGAMVWRADLFRKHGYGVLLFDFQAHGESGGEKITSGLLESKDASAAVEFVRRRAPGEKVAIVGASLGGAAAILAEPPLKVDGMILEMVYADIATAVKNRIEIVLGKWARPSSFLLTAQIKSRVGIDAEWFSPARRIASVDCPKLLIVGEHDRHAKVEESQALYDSAKGEKELWIVKGAAHEDLYGAAQAEYEQRVLKFLERAL